MTYDAACRLKSWAINLDRVVVAAIRHAASEEGYWVHIMTSPIRGLYLTAEVSNEDQVLAARIGDFSNAGPQCHAVNQYVQEHAGHVR